MIDSGNKNNLDALGRPDLINFHKRHLIAQVIQELKRYQCTCYNLIPVPEMNEWLLSRRAMEQEEIYEISLQAEPRDKPISDDSNMSNILQGSLRTRLMNTIKGTQK